MVSEAPGARSRAHMLHPALFGSQQMTIHDIPIDVWGQILQHCGDPERCWAALSQSCKGLLETMRSGACKDVKELKLNGRATDEHLEGVAGWFTGLEKLDLTECHSITDDGLEHVDKLSNLTTRHLAGCPGITYTRLHSLYPQLPGCVVVVVPCFGY